jgi:hypothetical protein
MAKMPSPTQDIPIPQTDSTKPISRLKEGCGMTHRALPRKLICGIRCLSEYKVASNSKSKYLEGYPFEQILTLESSPDLLKTIKLIKERTIKT